MLAAAGAGLVLVELEHVWGDDPRTLQAAAAACGVALLAASELRAWSRKLGEAAEDMDALRAHAAALGLRVAAIALVTAAFVALAHASVDATFVGIAGAAAAIALFAALLRLAHGLR